MRVSKSWSAVVVNLLAFLLFLGVGIVGIVEGVGQIAAVCWPVGVFCVFVALLATPEQG